MIISDLSCSWEYREIQWRREICNFQEKIIVASKDSWIRNNCYITFQERAGDQAQSLAAILERWAGKQKSGFLIIFAFSFPWYVRSSKDLFSFFSLFFSF